MKYLLIIIMATLFAMLVVLLRMYLEYHVLADYLIEQMRVASNSEDILLTDQEIKIGAFSNSLEIVMGGIGFSLLLSIFAYRRFVKKAGV